MHSVNEVRRKRVFVGLSGGVDSSVTAALLKEAGAEVTGVFIKGWYPEGMPCTWREDRADAMRAAAHLDIPFMTLDASAEYKVGVIDYLIREYRAGRTPNPDIMCNREVKFGAFLRFAQEQGADLIATGHYARTQAGQLLKGTDAGKDQSYFLWAVPTDALSCTLFPLGNIEKSEVRSLAKKYGLPQAEKPDSQGICFLGDVSVEDFLRKEFGEQPGEAVDYAGTGIGTHDGALLHTIGSRVSLTGADPGPWYVVAKDIGHNRLTVAKERTQQQAGEIVLCEANLLDTIEPTEVLTAQYRYHGPQVPGSFDPRSSIFTPSQPLVEPIAPGQSLVLYRGNRLVGGGIIA